MKKTSTIILLLAFGLGVAQVDFADAKVKPCSAPEYRQFDFWVGKWKVYRKAAPDKQIANSLIEKLYEGCGIRENWMPLKGGGGGSLNIYLPDKNVWRQFWIDSEGSMADLTGVWNGKSMVLKGMWPQPDKPDQKHRVTFTPQTDGSVEQQGEASDDDGKTWQPSFDLIYRRSSG